MANIKVTERIAKIEIDGSATVTFEPAYPCYGVYGDNIQVSRMQDFDETTTQGVYDTSDNGMELLSFGTPVDTLYFKGSGTAQIRCGVKPCEIPFVV